MSDLTPPDYCSPIPNGPFYSPQTWQICGSYLNYAVGFGICISSEGDMTNWSCGCGVSSLVAGVGIQVNALSTELYEVENTGAVAINPGIGISSTGGQCPILSLADSGAGPGGVYIHPAIIVDEYGRITEIHHRPATVECNVFTTCGDLIVAQNYKTGTALPVGPNGYVLSPDSTCALGMRWEQPQNLPYVRKVCLPSKGYLVTGSSTADTPIALAPVQSRLLLSCAGSTNGVCWGGEGLVADAANFSQCVTQPRGTTCCYLISSNFTARGCNFYKIQVGGYVESIDTDSITGTWQLVAGSQCSPIQNWTTNSAVLGVELPLPVPMMWLYNNNGSLSTPLYIQATTCSGSPAALNGMCWNISVFGF